MHFLSFLILTTTPLLPIRFTSAFNLQTIRSLDEEPVLHFTIARRGGAFANWDIEDEVVDLTYLREELQRVEGRYNLTRREAKGNKLVRRAKERSVGGNEVGMLMGEIAMEGRW